jgi:hypothetical protein
MKDVFWNVTDCGAFKNRRFGERISSETSSLTKNQTA